MSICKNHRDCVDRAMRQADQTCREQSVRLTDLRRRVLEIIWADHTPSKAYDILAELAQGHAAAKPPTVYRALDFLMQHGLVHKINSLNAYVGCSHPQSHRECYFLICQKCGAIEECCSPDIAKVISNTVNANDFTLRKATVEISGKCADCL